MTDQPLKCVSREFTSVPFYLVQSQGTDTRFVASFQDKDKIKKFLFDFISNSNDVLQIKIRDFASHEKPVDFNGQVSKQKLKDSIDKYADVIFHDGYHDLMIRRPETGDYLAFDEHGLVFIYTRDNYADTLKGYNLKYLDNEKLIYEFDHFHYRPANGREGLYNLIDELSLKVN